MGSVWILYSPIIVGVHSFHDLRAWQTARAFKRAVYRLSDSGTLARDFKLRDELRESAASAVSQVAGGFGRLHPADFARFMGIAKASLVDAQHHLQDAVDRGHITDETRTEHHTLAQSALRDVTSLLEYLQSPETADDARGARARRPEERFQNSEP